MNLILIMLAVVTSSNRESTAVYEFYSRINTQTQAKITAI